MMYIGTSLGGCLNSLMANEVSEDDVMFIVTRTMCPSYETFMDVVREYHIDGAPVSRSRRNQSLGEYDLADVEAMASRLYFQGKIHQPRVFAHESGLGYAHPSKYGNELWMQVVPTNKSTNPSVVEAWEKYKMLDALTK